jgi:hypothetical protein
VTVLRIRMLTLGEYFMFEDFECMNIFLGSKTNLNANIKQFEINSLLIIHVSDGPKYVSRRIT